MAFDIDLKNCAIDFALQDRAEDWCERVHFLNGKATISWPPSGKAGLKRAHLEGIPFYMLAYSHRTTPKVIEKQLTFMAIQEYMSGKVGIIELAKTYNMSEEFLCKEIARYISFINRT